MTPLSILINAHKTPNNNGLSPLQRELMKNPYPVRICSAPTGAGKTYAFVKAAIEGENILFFVPTKRLAQNLRSEVTKSFIQASSKPFEEAEKDAESRVVLWTSDQAEIDKKIHEKNFKNYRNQQINQTLNSMPEEGVFMIATMESVGHYLVGKNVSISGKGLNRPSLDEIMRKDHIVFDEFHTMTYRGYGLATAICATAQNYPMSRSYRPKVSFLSATPTDIEKNLIDYGIRADSITKLNETIISQPVDIYPENMFDLLSFPEMPKTDDYRWIHGNVMLNIHQEEDNLSDLLEQYKDSIKKCLEIPGQQILLVYDTLSVQNAQRHEIHSFFERMGLTNHDILFISSIHDSGEEEIEKFGRFGKGTDAQSAKVLVATSSIEMGVTFKTKLMFIEPGHSLSSFVQRLGRVARGADHGGVVALYNKRLKKSNIKFESTIKKLKSITDSFHNQGIDIEDLISSLLKEHHEDWKKEIDLEDNIKTFSGLPNETAWAAALFWAAMEWKYQKDARKDTLVQHRPSKAKSIGGCLRLISKNLSPKTMKPGALWATAFIDETLNMRGAIHKVYIHTPTERKSVPWHIYAKNPYLNTLPISILEHGIMEVISQKNLFSVMDEGTSRVKATLCTEILLPHQARLLSSPQGEEFETWRKYYKEQSYESLTQEDRKVLDAANWLITKTKIIPTQGNLLNNSASTSGVF